MKANDDKNEVRQPWYKNSDCKTMRNIGYAAILAIITLVALAAGDSFLPYSQARILIIDWLTTLAQFLHTPVYPSEIHGGFRYTDARGACTTL